MNMSALFIHVCLPASLALTGMVAQSVVSCFFVRIFIAMPGKHNGLRAPPRYTENVVGWAPD